MRAISLFWVAVMSAGAVFGAADPAPAYHGPKQTISVLELENKVQGVYGSAALGEGMTEILTTELVSSDRFVVLDRQNLRGIVKEQELAMTGLVNQETGVETGQMAGAQFFIKGAVTEFNPQAGGGGLSVGYRQAQVGHKSTKAHVGIDVRLVDNATGQIFAAYHATATARQGSTAVGTSFFHDDDPFKIGISGFHGTPLGVAVRDAVQDVVGWILREAAKIPWQGSVIRADGETIYINRGEGSGLRPGDRLTVWAPGEPLIDPETGFNLGSDEELLCAVEIRRVAENFSVASPGATCHGRPIDRGDIVRLEVER
jgi:curli biogenesis system outer membrane secretion channel CsgG